MLIHRIITGVIVFACLLALLFSGCNYLVLAVITVVFGLASWECFRLFQLPTPKIIAAVWALSLPLFIEFLPDASIYILGICAVFWICIFIPALKTGLPKLKTGGSYFFLVTYSIAVFGLFLAIYLLYLREPILLLSGICLVISADTGAYAFGRTMGKHKLAVSLSPSKTWEGAIGGWFVTLLLSVAVTFFSFFDKTFMSVSLAKFGWFGFILIISFLFWISVIGDLFESCLKRRAEIKDSSNLLPGHGGILDRVDALMPVIPMTYLFTVFF